MAIKAFDLTLAFDDGFAWYKDHVASSLVSIGEGLATVLRDAPRPEQILAEAVVSLGDHGELCDLPETREALATFVTGAIALLEGYRRVDERVSRQFPRLRPVRIKEVA